MSVPTDVVSLARELLDQARASTNGRAAHVVAGGPKTPMTQTLIALTAGAALGEHASPSQATVFVLQGHVRLGPSTDLVDGRAGQLLHVPPQRHSLEAVEDSVVVLSVAKH